ncbi:MAG: VWA domain-containing protein [Anaerolineales bacterium]|nr:VWA domain-containing protein [Anaerolineales bacterium]
MNLLWPGFLLLLGLIPIIIAAYIWILRRRRRYAVRYSSLSLVRAALPQQSRWRRHIPMALFLLGLSSLVVALGRPMASVVVPSGQATIVLAMDISGSMCATDIEPNRLLAAEEAALSFIRSQRSNTQIGIVVFAGFSEIIQPPTRDQDALEAAIRSLTTARRTAIGSGILKSLDAIAEVDESIPPSDLTFSGSAVTPVPPGTYAPHIIVLLTDGASNAGPWPLDAAQQAADRGVRVYTIGFGTDEGAPFAFCDAPFTGNFFGGGSFGGGGGFRRGIDEETLIQIAEMTDGEYYQATSASELDEVFKSLPTYLITKRETTEISFAFSALGALLAGAAILLSMLWNPLQ